MGVRLDGDPDFVLAPTINVEFKLRKTGNGSGRVTASKLDCGTVCTANYRLRQGDHADGECRRRVVVRRLERRLREDADDMHVPGGADHVDPGGVHPGCDRPDRHPATPAIGSRTRTSIAISWAGSTDNVRVAGYRVYVNDTPAGETQATAYTLEGLKCGSTYSVAVDAVDGLGNRSQRASVTTQTRPCALAARLAGVGVGRVGGVRTVVASVRVNRATTARLRLLRGGRAGA